MAVQIKVLPILALSLWLSACSTHKKVSSSNGTTAENGTEVAANEGSAEGDEAPVLPESQEPPRIGIWIEGGGLEAMGALGFMQELYASGLRFHKVVGTGFGCWVAISWAAQGSPNQAEWQTFKWDSWEFLEQGSFMSRITSLSAARDRFVKEVSRMLPQKEFRQLASDSDCPAIDLREAHRLRSTQSLGLQGSLWEQMQLPLFKLGVAGDESQRWVSGEAAYFPSTDEIDALSQTSRIPEKDVNLWIYIRSSARRVQKNDEFFREVTAERQESPLREGRTLGARRILVVNLGLARNAGEAKDFARRRNYLLEGRKRGQEFVGARKSELIPK